VTDQPEAAAPAVAGRPLLAIFLTVLVDVLALTLILPLLPFYARHFQASELQVGALFACFSACQLVSGPALGRLSDRIGRRPVLLMSQAGTLVGLLVLGAANSLWMLFLGRIIDGATAGNLSIAQAYITDVTRPEDRTKSYALIGIAFGFGFLVGPAASGLLAKAYGFHAPPLVAAGLSALSILLTAVMVKDPPKRARISVDRTSALGRLLRAPAPRAHLLELFAYAFSFSQLTSGLGLFLAARLDYDVEHVGYIFAFSGLIGGLAQGGIGRVARRFGEAKLARFGFLAMAVGYASLAQAYNLPVLLLATAIGALGGAVTRPAVTTLLTTSVDPSAHGEALGVSQSLTSAAQVLGPLSAGLLLGAGHVRGWALLAGASALLGLLFARTARPRVTNEESPPRLA